MIEADEQGAFPEITPAGKITNIMEIERTSAEADAVFNAAAQAAHSQIPAEVVFLFHGIVMDERGAQVEPQPKLFSSVEEAQTFMGEDYKVLPGERTGNKIFPASGTRI